MEISDFIAALSFAVALFTLGFYIRDRRHQRHAVLRDYVNSLLEWHGDTVCLLIRLKHNTTNKVPTIELLPYLSTQIEKGRYFFPNVNKGDNFGANKPQAYQGYRNLVLDFLVYSYNLYARPDANKYLPHADRLQREFTSAIIRVTRPQKNLKELRKLTNVIMVENLTFEDYLTRDPDASIFMDGV